MERLRKALGNVAETKGVITILAGQPIEQRREALHPALPAIIVELVTGKKAPDPLSTRVLLRFVAGELRRDPDLPPALFEALVITPPRHAHEHLHELYVLARDRRAIPLLRGGGAHGMWIDAIIALRAEALLDEVVAALAVAPTRELAVACAHVGGTRARAILESGEGDAVHPIGLALLANPSDKVAFAGSTPNRVMARRIHTALAAKGPKQRTDAIGDLAKGLDSDAPAPVERLARAARSHTAPTCSARPGAGRRAGEDRPREVRRVRPADREGCTPHRHRTHGRDPDVSRPGHGLAPSCLPSQSPRARRCRPRRPRLDTR